MKDELSNSQSQVYRSCMTQNIERRCACFQKKCIARAAENGSVINYVRQLNTSCQGPGSVLTIKYASYLGGLYD